MSQKWWILIFKAELERKGQKNTYTEKLLAYKVQNPLESGNFTLPYVGMYKGTGCQRDMISIETVGWLTKVCDFSF